MLELPGLILPAPASAYAAAGSGRMTDLAAHLLPQAMVDIGVTVGPDSRLWAFVHLQSGAVFGRGCKIGDHVLIEGGV